MYNDESPRNENNKYHLRLVSNIIHRQQDQLPLTGLAGNAAGVKQHFAVTDAGKIMLHQIVLKSLILWQDSIQQVAQGGGDPLSATQLVNRPTHGLFGRHLKALVKRTAGRDDLQFIIEHKQRFAAPY